MYTQDNVDNLGQSVALPLRTKREKWREMAREKIRRSLTTSNFLAGGALAVT